MNRRHARSARERAPTRGQNLYPALMHRLCWTAALILLACDPGPAPVAKPTTAPAQVATPAMPTAKPAPVYTPSGKTSNLKSDEHARIFPVIARRDGDRWKLRLHAWVYEPEEGSLGRGAAIEGLRAALDLPEEASESDIFRARARAFLVDNESNKTLVVRIGAAEHTLTTTGSNGHSETDLELDAAGLQPDAAGWVAIDVIAPTGDSRQFGGAALLLTDTGTSVISDVDDTIKISEVRDKKKLLARTFLREFEAVPGMAAAYRRWAGAGRTFHYVSASPWQLFDALGEFVKTADYPRGSMHLKQFRVKDSSFFSLFEDPQAYKRPILQELISRAPGRRFVLIGDSGEMDPEAYGAAFREFPTQVAAIYIRDVSGEPREAPRYATAFADVPADRWTIFTDPAVLPATLP
jgi:phosphatidate phosphatase APP1